MEHLLENARGFFTIAEKAMELKLYTVAVVNYFKAAVALVDYAIFRKLGIFPKDHLNRIRILLNQFPEISGSINAIFDPYRRAYREKLDREIAEYVREEVMKIAEVLGLKEVLEKS